MCGKSVGREERPAGSEVVRSSSPSLFHNELGVAQKGILCEVGTANGLWRYRGLMREGLD